MAQTKQPEALSVKQNLSVLLEQDKDRKTYLTQVAIYPAANLNVFWGSEMDEKEFQERKIEFSMVFYYNVESEKSLRQTVSVAYFSKDTTNYKIYQASFLNNWAIRETKNHFLKPMSYEASKGRCVYIGNSDNEELLVVKVWKYAQEN